MGREGGRGREGRQNAINRLDWIWNVLITAKGLAVASDVPRLKRQSTEQSHTEQTQKLFSPFFLAVLAGPKLVFLPFPERKSGPMSSLGPKLFSSLPKESKLGPSSFFHPKESLPSPMSPLIGPKSFFLTLDKSPGRCLHWAQALFFPSRRKPAFSDVFTDWAQVLFLPTLQKSWPISWLYPRSFLPVRKKILADILTEP